MPEEPLACPACQVRVELLEEGGDHEGVMLMQTVARLSRQVEEWASRYRGLCGKQSFPVEVNGPAHIIMALDFAAEKGREPNLKAIRNHAEETIAYIESLGRGERLAWHEVAKKKKGAKL